jgi:hypothetical protein
MEADIMKNFIRRDVEILVGGVWIMGHLMPVVKNVITLIPIGQEKEFYGPTACKMEVIQAIREVKMSPTTQVANPVNNDPSPPPAVKSGFGAAPQSNHPGNKFVHR